MSWGGGGELPHHDIKDVFKDVVKEKLPSIKLLVLRETLSVPLDVLHII